MHDHQPSLMVLRSLTSFAAPSAKLAAMLARAR